MGAAAPARLFRRHTRPSSPFLSGIPSRSCLFVTVLLFAFCLAAPKAQQVQLRTPPDFDRMMRLQEETDQNWRTASAGYMQFEKIVYPSSAGDLDVPAFVFRPLKARGLRSHPAI